MKVLYALFFCFALPAHIYAQPLIDSNGTFIRKIVDELPEAGFYFIGQLHNNEANTILEKELLFSLNRRFGVTYDVLEYSHSVAVILNEYLRTGQDSLLSYIKKGANFNFIRSVRNFNDSVPERNRIRFYGIDFEGRNHGDYTKKAISIILQQVDKADPLSGLLQNCVESDSLILRKSLQQLKKYLDQNAELSKSALGHHYLDIYLIASAAYGFSPKRDRAMYDNFKFLYNELALQSASPPRFFASFGIGHVDPANRRGLASLLNSADDSPVKARVRVIGVQYLNCYFGSGSKLTKSAGNLSFLCPQRNFPAVTAALLDGRPTLRYARISEFGSCEASINKLAGIILVENFKATSNWTWE